MKIPPSAPSLDIGPAREQMPIDIAPFHEWALQGGTLWAQFYRTDAGYLLRFPGFADFNLSPTGLDVTSYPAPDVARQAVEHLYLNQVLPLALSKQGKLVFHASAVDIGGMAVAFMGASGKGKSTLAASFATSGCRFLTDDGLMVETCEGGYQIMPSHPSVRLWQDSAAALIAADTPTAPALEFTSKSRFLAGDNIPFCDSPRPLRRVYFLGDGGCAAVTFQYLKPAEALIELVKHTFLLDIEEREMLLQHFGQLTDLVKTLKFFRLDFPRRYEFLATVREAIVQHARSEPNDEPQRAT